MSERRRCNKCSSTLTYLRIKDKEVVCRHCGNIEKIKDEEKKEEKIEDANSE